MSERSGGSVLATDDRGVLVTRPPPGLAETCAAVASRGFRPIAAPLLAIENRSLRLPLTTRPSAILVTSGHALVRALPRASLLIAVGDRTAARARSAGWAEVVSAAGDAEDLGRLTRQLRAPRDGPLLLACGEGQGLALTAGLREAGFTVIRRVVYAQRPARAFPRDAEEAFAGSRLGASLFMSGATARAFARLLPARLRPALARVEALAISEKAARPVAALPWRRVRVALRPTAEDVLALL